MCNITDSEDDETFSCGGLTITEDIPKDPNCFVGALFDVSGKMLTSIPPKEGADVLTMDGNPVRIAVLKSGELQLTSLVTTNDKVESIKYARDSHRHEIQELKETLARLSAEKAKAEEAYSDALANVESDDDEDDGNDDECDEDDQDETEAEAKDRGKMQAALLLKLVTQEKALARRLQKLEDLETLKVTFAIQGGMTASMQPGIVTAVPFVANPMVWCPKSLAKARPIDDTVDVVTVPISAMTFDTPSQILDEVKTQGLLKMLAPVGKAVTLSKLHDQTAGASAVAFDRVVRLHSNVLTVIQSNTGQIFGGFYVEAMGISTNGWHKGHDDDFIFSLGHTSHKDPEFVKLLKPKGWTHQNARTRNNGLQMGDARDLLAFSDIHKALVPKIYTVPAEGYSPLPTGQSIAVTPGSFIPVKMEVYRVCVNTEE